MGRGLAAALALAAATVPAVPASAASGPVVWELVRRPGSYPTALVKIFDTAENGPDIVMYASLVPNTDHGGYLAGTVGVQSSASGPGATWVKVDLTRGQRFLVGGVRGRVRLHVNERGWSFRETRLGFRYRLADPADQRTVAGMPVETFDSVSAPGGRYGSAAWGHAPCYRGAGLVSLENDAEPSGRLYPHGCANTPFTLTRDAGKQGTWTFGGTVVGTSPFPHRLAVIDYPPSPPVR